MPVSSSLLPDPAAPSLPCDVESALRQWCAAHPQATLAEIERAVDQHLSTYRAALILTAAAAAPSDERPRCAACATPLQRVGMRSRRLRTAHAGELTFTEPAWRCPACGAGFFPPD